MELQDLAILITRDVKDRIPQQCLFILICIRSPRHGAKLRFGDEQMIGWDDCARYAEMMLYFPKWSWTVSNASMGIYEGLPSLRPHP